MFTALFVEISVDRYKNEIGNIVGNILCEESSDEETVEALTDLLLVITSPSIHTERTQTLIKGVCLGLKRFDENEKICTKFIEIFRNNLTYKESK